MAGLNAAVALAAGALVIVGVLTRIAKRPRRRRHQPIDVGTVRESWLAERRSVGSD